MKKFLLSFATFALAVGFVGCTPTPDPEEGNPNGGNNTPSAELAVSVTAGNCTVSSISFSVDADEAQEVKYVVTLADGTLLADDDRNQAKFDDKMPSEAAPALDSAPAEMTAEYAYENGTAVSDVPTKVTIAELVPYTEYNVWAVALGSDNELLLSEKVTMKTNQGSLELSGLGNYDNFSVSPSGATANWIVQDASQLKSWCLAFHNVASLDELSGKYYFCSSQEKANELAGKENAPWIDVNGSSLICDGVTVHFAADSADNYLEAYKSTESNSTSFRLNALSYSGKYVLTGLYLKGGEAEPENVKAGREMDSYTTLEIVKNANQYTLIFTGFAGTFTCVVETTDGVLAQDGFTTYELTEDGAGNWKSGSIREDSYKITITSGKLLVRKMDDTTYRFIIDAQGTDASQGVEAVISCKASNGWDATVKSYTDEEKPAEKIALVLTSVTVPQGTLVGADDYTSTFTGTDAEGNKVVLFCHSAKDYLLYTSYIASDFNEAAKLNNNVPHLYWVEAGKSYVEYKGVQYKLQANNPNAYFKVSKQNMPAQDNNTVSFLAWDEANEKEFSFTYTGAFGYPHVIQQLAFNLSSLSYAKQGTAHVFDGTDSSNNKLHLVLGTEEKYNNLEYARKAKYFFRPAFDASQSNKHWADTSNSYIEYEGTKYMLQSGLSDCYAQVVDTAMPETNSTTIKVIAMTTTGYKKFTIEYSGSVNGYAGKPVEMKSIAINGWVPSGMAADANDSSFSTFLALSEVASATYQVKFNVAYSASALKVGKHYVASSQAQANEFAGEVGALWLDAATSAFYYNSNLYSLMADKDSYLLVKEDGTFEYSVKTSNGLYNFHGTGSAEVPEANEEVGQ